MSMRELDRIKTIQAVVDGHLKPGLAAQRLGLMPRQVQRLVRRFCAEGSSGLLTRQRGQPSNHQLPDGQADAAMRIVRQRYADFGPTLACEKLRECHGIVLAADYRRTGSPPEIKP